MCCKITCDRIINDHNRVGVTLVVKKMVKNRPSQFGHLS